ncbi:hypothetical protein LZ496_09725 [Sphingomonas sp. NSE70-1]|uniref:Secreted protein n=1 Tax=Sphingomonas caseinilyticus TaxID=2908205 RepID=A0ABT0RVM2_9SPHN|nr:hypothetical protein [Sphingomonas caseinilyticus]MCL6699058.1 hypothetical protein [Sphingomonas caseinilyticus]
MRLVLVAALSLCMAAPVAAGGDKQPPDRMPSEMTPTEIKAYNADIERSHPYYITCRKTEVMGSLVKKLRVCRTNDQWREASFKGNENAADTLEAMRRAPVNSSN